MAVPIIDPGDPAGHLVRTGEPVWSAAELERALERRKHVVPWFPRCLIRVPPFHREELPLSHPMVERCLNSLDLSGNGALGRDMCRSAEPGGKARLSSDHCAGLLLEESLLKKRCRDPDVVSQLHQLGVGQPLTDIPFARLQLRRAVDDPLECCAVYAPVVWDEISGQKASTITAAPWPPPMQAEPSP